MWTILEHRQIEKAVASAPVQVRKKYEFWKNVVRVSGPEALAAFRGFDDEALAGQWQGYRSSRLNQAYRVIYKVERDHLLVKVERVPNMTIARDYVPEKRHAKLTPGEALKIARELQGFSQSELARRTGIAQSALSALESGDTEMGLKRVTVLAKALKVHPAVIAFPDWNAPIVDLYDALKRVLQKAPHGARRHTPSPSRARRVAR